MPKRLSFIFTLILLSTNLSAQISDDSRFYPNPGIVAQRGGRWVGSDHLYNLTDQIDVVVEIFKPSTVDLPVTEEMLRSQIAKIFKKGGITPIGQATPGEPILPFFHMLIMVYPIDRGYVCFCEGRLFEKVNLDRIRLDEQTVLQAITWESQNLVITPTAEIESQIGKMVDEIGDTFVDRFQFYEEIRRKIQK